MTRVGALHILFARSYIIYQIPLGVKGDFQYFLFKTAELSRPVLAFLPNPGVHFFRHVLGISSTSIGYSSSRPSSISMHSTTFASGEKNAKFPAGPHSPRPGPILLNVARTAVSVVEPS